MSVVPFVVAIPSAYANIGLAPTPQFPPNVTVGQTGLPASIQVQNTSTSPESAGTVTVTTLTLVPACGTSIPTATGDCPAGFADPGVIALSPTGIGEAGTQCAGEVFNITTIDPATGQVQFVPVGPPIVLTPPGSPNSICRIDFTFSVLRAPTRPASVSGNTLTTDEFGFASGTSSVTGQSGFGFSPGQIAITKAAPTITTTATPASKVGSPITDTATLAPASPPGPAPTGTITFSLYGPQPASPATCTGTPAFTSTVPVNAGAGSYTSAPFTPTGPGTYRWIAAYSGDANNAAATTACGDAGETATISQATPTIVTAASAPTTIGGPISDTAMLSGGFSPTGTIVFSAFGPADPTCTGTAAFTSTVPVAGNGTYSSASFIPTAPGSYNWVAAYSGDANNAAVTSACGSNGETSTVTRANPTIVTTASGPVMVGGTISDSAVLAGGVAPTGTITFNVFGPANPTCTGTPAFTSMTTVSGNGTYSSATFTTTQAGTYQFVAAYSGDANNNAVTSLCSDPKETVVVARTNPTIMTTASPTVAAGGQISDTATLQGGVAPTGTIVFTLFGPGNPTCSGAAIFTSTKPVTGNGVYPSDPFTTSTPGVYNWVAVYSGDANNAGATSPCGATNESVTVTRANPAIVTTASASVAAGNPITDTAALSGGAAPTGTITFTVFGPGNPTCTGTAVFTSTVPVAGNGNYTSAPFTPTAAGTYQFVAVYSGDANNNPVTSACGAANESVTVTRGNPTIVTTASAPVAVGNPIHDTATLANGVATPTGTITFTLFGPGNVTCTGTPIFTSTVPVNAGNGSYVSGNFTPTAAGTYRFIAAYSGDVNNNAVTTACGDANEAVVVSPATPTIVTRASATVTVGQTISDTATLSGGVNPTGTITFTVFGPNDATCATAPAFTSVTAVNAGNGTYPSGTFTTTAAGTYRFVAAYSGDANNAAVTTLCNDPNESVVVAPAAPALVTTASASVPVGGTISDTATLSGGVSPTGTITFTLFGPGNPTCTGIAIFTSTKTVTGNGNYTSGPFTVTAPGTYQFVAVYSGDANNASVTSACGAANESVVVTKASPAIVTVASASVPAGGTISDTATLSGGVAPTGTIVFSLFGPGNATCTGTAIFTSTKTVTGNGNYTSDPFTTTTVGTYRWVAAYSGDANNAAMTTGCNDANESVVVTPAAPAIVTHASAGVTAGGAISDTATLSGGTNPTGTITFTLFGPGNATCTGLPIFTSTVPVNAGNGNYTSASFTANPVGTYQFVAVYSGDANNAGATSACGAANESVVVTKTSPMIVTVASAPVAAGGTITDTATLSGAVNPTGTITFTVFGPNDATCALTPAFTSTKSVNANGAYTSSPFTVTLAGTYRFVAAYSGDANNAAVTTACNDPNESVVVGKAPPNIVTVASGTVAAGGAVTDTATLSGGVTPTGTITFTLFGPNNATCTGTAIFTSTVPVNSGNGNYTSAPFTTVAAGTYRWIAAYSGDANNAAATTACNDANESVVVTKTAPIIATQASGPVTVGGTINDTASLSGGTGPTGTITFTVFGPNNATCSGTPAFTATVPVAGNGNYLSGPFTPTAPGTYRFVAVYSGDANNSPAGPTACADPAEAVVVSSSNPTIVTAASAPVPVGGTITDTATLAGGVNPTGTITFQVFGPNNNTCSGIPIFTSTRTVAGNGNYTSAPFTTPAAGTYRFVATYSGDANNSPAGPTACTDPAEASAGLKASPAIATLASAPIVLGGTINDTAILTGGFNPTGTITFNLFGPNNTTCTGTAIFTAMVIVNGTGNYASPTFTPTAPGNYTFVASYSGDVNNNAAGPTACNDPAETVPVSLVATNISTTASPSADVGQPISDTATLGGSGHPTGTITFTLFGPNNATCTGTPAFTSMVTVNGTGSYTSAQFIPTAAGTYTFVAVYSGDANNKPAGPTPCNDPAEAVVVLPRPQISVTKAASPLTRPEPGGNFTFTVTVSNPSAVDPVKITSLFDNIYGDLATRPGSTCGTLIGVTLAPGATSPPCTFTGPFTGKGGDSQTDTVTVTGVDSHGVMVTATAQATVTLTTVLPSISVTKVANPLTRPEPGGIFTFTVQVTNNNTVDPITITKLVDNIYGDLATRAGSTCSSLIGLTLAPGATSPPCTFTGPFNGKGGDTQTDTVTVTGQDSQGNTATATAKATVALTSLTPVIAVTKAANPLTLPEPGGTFTFTVQVSNPSPNDPIKITSLVDNIYGDLATRAGSNCGLLIGVTLAPGAVSAPCSFTGPFTGVGGASQTDTVTVKGVDSFGNTATATAQATVSLTTVTPQIKVTKAASPPSLAAPGGTFTFTVQVSNPSTVDPVKITSLVDNIYGDLATRAGSTCGALIGTTLAPGATSAPCTFSGPFTGVSGASQTDTVTVTGVDSVGHTVTATAQATVTLTPGVVPQLSVSKTASPLSLPEPGGTFTFTVQVTNPSTVDPIKITSLVDNIYGDLATRPGSTCGALIGTTLAPGATSAPCSFTGPFTGVGGASQTDTVTVKGVDSNGNTATATAQATVTLTTVTPQIKVTKAASPLSMAAPGGTFTFTVQVSNPSTVDPVKITSLVDNIYGDLATRAGSTCGTLIGTTLAPGATSAPCTFTGPFTGKNGDSQTDIVTVTGVDTLGHTVTSTAQATVVLTVGVLPQLAVSKAADPLSKPEPGGSFTFTVRVTNPSTVDPIKITSLVDNIYGDLATRPGSTCGALIGTTLAPGATSAPCTFTGPFTGKGGDSQTDIVTAKGVDSNGNTATATAQATVTLTTVTPLLRVTKAASPLSLPAPGGTFIFTVQVSNPSTVDPVKITSLVDNIYGDLATRAGSTCGTLIGTTLAPGATSAPCTFTGPFTGKNGDSQTDIVTVTGVDTAGHTVTSTAQATVTLTPGAIPLINVTKAAQPPSLPEPGGTFTFTVTVSNPSLTVPVTITSLVDNIYGNLATLTGSTCGALIGITLAPGAASPPCTFTGRFTGKGGDSQTDIVTVTGIANGNTVTATARATVTLTALAPMLAVTKSANPLTLPQPGGTFTFTVTVSNPSGSDPVKITSLVDNIYGDLATRPGSTCGALIGLTLAPGATSPACTFTGSFNGAAGASQTDIVTATGKDTLGNTATAVARATVGISAAPRPLTPLALTGANDRRPLAVASALLLAGLLLVLVGTRRRRHG